MKSIFSLPCIQMIVVGFFMAASVTTLSGQESRSSQRLVSARQTFEVASTESDLESGNRSVSADSSQQTNPGSPDQTSTKQSSAKQTTRPPYLFPTEDERFKRFLKNTVGPVRLGRTAISAGIDQWRDHPTEWGQGMSGYGKRFASGLGKNAIRHTVTYALDEAMDLDTGFERSRRKGFLPRLGDALLENVTSRTRTGSRVFSVPKFAGVYAGAIIPTETWYPSRYSYKDGLRSGTRVVVTGFGINVIREFLIRW
jgi:hypothetical protein